jgi:hypothetical protein
MFVTEVGEVVKLCRLQQESSRKGVYRSVAPLAKSVLRVEHNGNTHPLVVEATVSIQILEELTILGAAEKVHVCYFEIAPEVTQVPKVAVAIAISESTKQRPERPWKEGWIHHCGPYWSRSDLMQSFIVRYLAEQRRHCRPYLPERHHIAIPFIVPCHFDKGIASQLQQCPQGQPGDILCNLTRKAYVRFNAPVPLISLQ